MAEQEAPEPGPDAGTVTATAPVGGTATATSSPPLVMSKTVEHGEASAMPEIGWLWRRLYIFPLTGALCWMIFTGALNTKDVPTLREIIRGDQILLALMMLLYLAGASTEAITRLVGAIKTSRKETVTEAPAAPVTVP